MLRSSTAALALLLWSAPALAQPPVPAEARARLDRGEQLFAASAWDAALAEYEAAYEALAGHPSRYVVLFNLAQCHERAARYDEARTAYQRYLDEGGANDSDAADVRARIGALEGLLGSLEVTLLWPGAAATAELWVSGRRVGTAPGSVRLPGGTHAVEVRAAGYERTTEVVTLTAGATRAVEIAMRHLGRGLDPAIVVTRDSEGLLAHRMLALDARPIGEVQPIELPGARAIGIVARPGSGTLPIDLHAWRGDGELVRAALGCER